MNSCLLAVGPSAGRMLPTVFTALSCGAAFPVPSLKVFSLLPSRPGDPEPAEPSEAASLASAFSACHDLLAPEGDVSFFPSSFDYQGCALSFRSVRDLYADPDTALLVSALRGKGLPLSFQTDREAVEWCCADLLSRPEDPSIRPLIAWLDALPAGREQDPLRLTLLADLCDPFAAGVLFALLAFLNKRFSGQHVFISLIALAETSSPLPDTFFPALRASLQDLEDRSLADALWMLSLPSSMAETEDTFRLTALSAARVIGRICSEEDLLTAGVHTLEMDGTLSVSSLGDQASSFAVSLQSAAWLLSDLLPALRSWIAHPARLRGLAANPRNAVFRQLFSSSRENLLPAVTQLESALRTVVGEVLSLMRALPASLRLSADTSSLWQNAVNACGRYITVASELDTSTDEAHESGLDAVRPVHRVSLADTDEEQLARRLQDMRDQLEAEGRARAETLSALGGYRSLQVRQDCLARCRAALEETMRRAADPPAGEDRFTAMKRERRVRLLMAAVARCEKELTPDALLLEISAPAAARASESDPYAGVPLTSESCHALEQLLQAAETDSLPRIPSLFPDVPEADPKARMKSLAVACRDASPADPLAFFVARVLEVCARDLSEVRLVSRGVMPRVPLLPDLFAESPLLSIGDLLSRLPSVSVPEQDVPACRGLLAMLLLRQYRRRASEEAALTVSCLKPESSPVLRYWLESHSAKAAYVLSLSREEKSYPFALVLPGQQLIPARLIAAQKDLIPSFAIWFDPEALAFSDPCASLGEGDRKLLLELLPSYLKSLPETPASPLRVFLSSFLEDLSREQESAPPSGDWKTRLRSVCGLSALPAYEDSLSKVSCFYEHYLAEDPVASCLTGVEGFPPSVCSDIPEEILYLFRGVPFAREDSRFLLDSPRAAGEDYTLARLKSECEILSASSDDYRDALLSGLRKLQEKYPSADPDYSEALSAVLSEAAEPVDRREPVFTWPWDPKSPSMLTVLRESLGADLSTAALDPFTDLLAVFPARGREIIGDSLFSAMCVILPRENNLADVDPASVQSDAVLPPLSPDFGRALCTLPEGRTLLKPDLLRFEHEAEGAFRVTLTLDGVFPVQFVRVYSAEETLNLYSHDIPTAALWPSVPFRAEDWHSYYVYAHLQDPFTLSVCTEKDGFRPVLPTSGSRCVAVLPSFPVCFSFSRKDPDSGEMKTAGLLPNVLPEPLIHVADPVEICVDFGSSGTSVVFVSGHSRRPMNGPVMVRSLLINPSASRDLLRREFLPAVPVSALLPTVSRLFRNVPGTAPVPFADGIILMPANLNDLLGTPPDAVYTSLKWEEEKGRSGFVCLHQVLLMAALQARFEGASALSWRFSLPDEMAKEGRESLMNLFLSLCESVLKESGYPCPPEGLPVAFASESSALGAYFRLCAAEDTRGGFMVLDLGSCTADISLFLRGREQAVRTCQIPLGVHYMLLPSLLRDPDLLISDFGFCPDEAFRSDLSLLARALSAARTDPVAFRRARVALDLFVADHLPLLMNCALQRASAGQPSRTGALLILHFAYLMMLSGLVLLQLTSDPSRNDYLPEQMSLCISGRGASLLESLPPQVKTSLWHFLSMFRNRKVASLSLLFSAEKKMEIPVGLSLLQDVYHMLPPAPSVPASIAVRPAELLPEFLLRFRREFPASAELLFPGFFTGDPYHPFSARGDAVIAASVDQSFPPADTPRPYDSLSAWIGNLLDLLA